MPPLVGEDDGIAGYGVAGRSININSGHGVLGESSDKYGVFGSSAYSYGVYGASGATAGVYGISARDIGVHGHSGNGYGVQGTSVNNLGVYGQSSRGAGVYGISESGAGMYGFSDNNYGVHGHSENYAGVYGNSYNDPGVLGFSSDGAGVYGQSSRGAGVYGISDTDVGVYGYSSNNLAALLEGNVTITGNLAIAGTLQKGGGSFKIDHPLDPANKYLSHSFVESPDMKNVYDGVVVLDDKGEAEIELPDWFGALNKDFRYQLTAIGAPAPNLHIAEEISSDGVTTTTTTNYYSNSSNNNENNNINSRFKVAGGTSGMKVSWQVTGIRKDPYANAHRIRVEEDKPAKERGYYTYPELYGQPEEKGIGHLLFPTDEEEKKELLLINDDQNKLTT
jgi:hypothetical protein